MDLIGPLPTAQGNYRFAAVAVDYFTKWVEEKPLMNIKAPTIQKFFWQNIICKFGVPRELTVDNGKQFDYYTFREYCKTLGDELPKVIWSHNTTVSRATGFTPFRLLFGTEAMTPEEIKNESMRVLKAKEIEEIDQKVEKI
jgi:hypothetical protein